MKASRFVLSVLFLATGLWAGPFLQFSMQACGGSTGTACNFTPVVRTPQPNEITGLTDPAFQAYFANVLNGQSGLFTWSVTDSNASGVVIGSVNGPNQIATQFVLVQNQLTCCFIDQPFRLSDINDNGLIIGYDPLGGPSIFDANNLGGGFPSGLPHTIIFDPLVSLSAYTAGRYLGIDSQNRILGVTFTGQTYVLDPVPEPSSWILLGSSGIGFLVFRRRRQAKKS